MQDSINPPEVKSTPPPSNTGEVAIKSLWDFLRPIGKSSKKGKAGMAAIKKEQLSEHGQTSLSKQQQQNIKDGQ